MKKTKIMAIISMILSIAMLASLYSCTAARAESVDLMEDITANTVVGKAADEKFTTAHANFSVELFKRSFEGENTLVSPLSVMLGLGMVGGGTVGDSQEQFTALFGGIPSDELNRYLYTYTSELSRGDKYSLDLANSVWLTDELGYDVKESFLQDLADYYGADAFSADFQADETVDNVNRWIEEKTDGMIKEMLGDIDIGATMLLVNTILFEAVWDEMYEKSQVRDGVFTTENGEERKVSMMYSTEGKYLEGENATGVIKPYKGGKYAFAALLPKEGVSLGELVDSLSGEKVTELLSSASNSTVYTSIPEFECDFAILLNSALEDMGLTAPFDMSHSADFVGIYADAADHQFHISRVLHKTKIKLTPMGTKAGAATVVELEDKAGIEVFDEEPKEVYLDRPFVYMIVDTETNLPVFVGAVTDIGE